MATASPSMPKVKIGPTQLFINNEFVDAASGKTFETINPATEEVITTVAEADKEDVNRAVKAARDAFEGGPWRTMSGAERGRIMWKLADLMQENFEELARLEVIDNGKPIADARAVDIPLTIDCFRYYAGWCDKNEGRTIPIQGNNFCYTRHEPCGVVGQIIPWNFPLLMLAWKVCPALACGNCIVLKVAEQTPLTALRLGELMVEAGFPPGVMNILSGYGPTAGQAIARHMDVNKVAFTGSTEVGGLVMIAAGQTNMKGTTLEMGGKSPNIVFDDADLDAAVEGTFLGLMFNMGQDCSAGSRTFVHEKIYDEYLERVVERARKMVIGDPFDDNTTHGAQIDKEQFEKILKYIEKGKQEKARLMIGGNRHGDKGYFVEPTIFADVTDDMTIAREEIFGPVMSILKFKDEDEAIKRANNTEYGLAAGVWTRNINRAQKIVAALKAGTVWINCYGVIDAAAPFGGFKQSGFGRDLGQYALQHYTEVKTVTMAL